MRLWHTIMKFFNSGLLTLAIIPLATVIISWDASPEADVMGYRIYYGNASGNYINMLDVGKVTEYTLNNITENTPYFFAVTAYDTAGNESSYSEEVSIVIAGEDPGDPQPPVQASYNFPNPFKAGSEVTRIRYVLENPAEVSIEIYNMSNDLIKTIIQQTVKLPGEHTEDTWDGRDENGNLVANGLYLCKIRINDFNQFIKIAVSK